MAAISGVSSRRRMPDGSAREMIAARPSTPARRKPPGRRVHIAGRGEGSARPGEDCGQHGDTEGDTDLAEGRVGPGGLGMVVRHHVGQDGRRAGREHQAHADAGDGERGPHLAVGSVGRQGEGDPEHRGGQEHETDEDREARAGARRERVRSGERPPSERASTASSSRRPRAGCGPVRPAGTGSG